MLENEHKVLCYRARLVSQREREIACAASLTKLKEICWQSPKCVHQYAQFIEKDA